LILRFGTDDCKAAFDGAVIAFGVFDGFHKGHQFIVSQAIEQAQSASVDSVALTFDIDPDELFAATRLQKLASNDDRIAALQASGVDCVVVLPFTRDFAALSPADFLAKTFADAKPTAMHVGSDFRFGDKASGAVDDLRAWAAPINCEIHAHELVQDEGSVITSTRIRLLLADGNLDDAAELLGHPYCLSATVMPGRGEGTDFGFATANLKLPDNLMTLKTGVYAGFARVDDQKYPAAISFGQAPSFDNPDAANCEVHILDFSGELYGQEIAVEFHHRLRDLRAFDDIEELQQVVGDNINWVKEHMRVSERGGI